MAFRVNLSGKSRDKADAGLFAESGWYRAVLKDAGEDSETSNMVLLFEIRGDGARVVKDPSDKKKVAVEVASGDGLTVKSILYNPDLCDSPEKEKKATDKAAAWAKRMGADSPDDWGNPDVEPDFVGCIGKEYVIQVEQAKDWKTGDMKPFAEITYLGVFPLDYDKPTIPPLIREALKLPPAKGMVKADAAPASRFAGAGAGSVANGSPAAEIDVSGL